MRKILYTTNSIESLNYQLRKIIKNRGHFPNDDSVVKLLWLAIRDIEDKRARERAREAGRPRGQPRKAPPKLVEGGLVQGWKAAYGALRPGLSRPSRPLDLRMPHTAAPLHLGQCRRRADAVKMQPPTGGTILTAPSTGAQSTAEGWPHPTNPS